MPAVLPRLIEKRVQIMQDLDKDTYVIVRQATRLANEMIAEHTAERTQSWTDETLDTEVRVTQKFNPFVDQRLRVFYTIADCNIMVDDDEKGKPAPLFIFKGEGSSRHLAMNEHQFAIAWGRLPEIYAKEIYDAVLQVNPHWKLQGEAT